MGIGPKPRMSSGYQITYILYLINLFFLISGELNAFNLLGLTPPSTGNVYNFFVYISCIQCSKQRKNKQTIELKVKL